MKHRQGYLRVYYELVTLQVSIKKNVRSRMFLTKVSVLGTVYSND